MKKLRLALLASGLVGVVMPAHANPTLAPHRAVYDLALDEATESSGITGLKGRMVYEFTGGPCEGYSTSFRFVTQIDTNDASRLTDQQTTTFEDASGKRFDFDTKSFIDQALDKEVAGTAKSEADKLDVEIRKPENQTIDLARTNFPTQHMIDLLNRAAKGENFYETTLFDGSDNGDKVMSTTVVMGKKTAPATEGDPELPVLKDHARDQFWPVDIAYFNTENQNGEGLPEYRISFKLHENGVTRDMTMDYGDFSMKAKLVDLSLLKPAEQACTPKPE
ncbi:MAG: DUF1849 domain-containing protein [Mesorhizobium amorphae]|nr:MAG: DUF1849 domain-containing protein [Mesorhizobium amorphae]